jgi:hypothetical protein
MPRRNHAEDPRPFANVRLSGPLLESIKDKAHESQTSITSWCTQVLADFLREHRSNRFQPDPDRHWARNGADEDHVR